VSRPTVNDIARAAGVSLATVDRVMNARPGVRENTIRKVNEAIQRLGYVRDVAAANLARQRIYRFVVVLPDVPSQFLQGLRQAIEAAGLLADRTEVRIVVVPPRDPHALVRRVTTLGDRPDGVAIMATETPHVRDLIAHLKGEGAAVVSLVTDQPNAARDHFIGIDNLAAGRTAARLLGRFVGPRPGAVAVVVNTMLARDMVERRLGFDAVMAESFPHLRPLPSLEGHDDHELTERVTALCLAGNPDTVGLYLVGAGTRGVSQAIRASGIARPVFVGHELTPHTRAALMDGTMDAVITQDVGHIARSTLRVLRARADGFDIDPAQERIRIEIILKENLP
jgi:LacI family transcriptional regulator